MTATSALYDFMIGDWSVEFSLLPEGAKVGSRAVVAADWFLDQTAILDQWRHLDESGTVNFRGMTFRTYLPDKDLWYMLWMTPAVEGFSELYGCRAGEEVHTSGKGKDPGGDFVERGRYWAIRPRHSRSRWSAPIITENPSCHSSRFALRAGPGGPIG